MLSYVLIVSTTCLCLEYRCTSRTYRVRCGGTFSTCFGASFSAIIQVGEGFRVLKLHETRVHPKAEDVFKTRQIMSL